MNPTEIIAKLRTAVLKLGVIFGGLVFVVELWRWLIHPGGWQASSFRELLPFGWASFKAFCAKLFAGLWPPDLADVWIVQRTAEAFRAMPAFVGVPLAAALVVVLIYAAYTNVVVPLFHLCARIGFWLGHRFRGKRPKPRRHLVICIDGTWNFPEELEGGIIKSSNVYKFWDNLKGERRKLLELTVGADLLKYHRCADGTMQIGLYYPGVGNPATYSTLGTAIGGAFGFGAASMLRESYRDVIRYYRSDADKITIVGFSRGAAIARWLASYIEREGVPHLTVSDTKAGKFVVGLLRTLLPKVKWIQRRDVEVEFLGVWDTVASFGLAKNVFGIPFQRINLFKSFNVSSAVRHVVHLVAVDEQRDAFLPTPIEPPKPGSRRQFDTTLEEIWFPGVHSNVGGGFLNDGLSQISLEFMTAKFRHHFAAIPLAVELESTDFGKLEDNIKSPLRPSSGAIYEMLPRDIPDNAVLHESVFKKMALASRPVVNPDGPADLDYAPPNVLELMDRLAARKDKATVYHDRLKAEGVLSDRELSGAADIMAEACRLKVARLPTQ